MNMLPQLSNFIATVVRDDTMVYEAGCGPAMVHLKDTTYPSCHRVTMGCCYKTLDAKTAELASYSQNYCPSGCATQSSTLPLPPPPRPLRLQPLSWPPQAHWHAAHARLRLRARGPPVAVCV